MPIRPENQHRYPTNWAEISFRIRFVRALGHCECTGQCGRHKQRCHARHNGTNPRTGSKVVLTVAHLDHTPENCDDANLLALCQACHLAYDADEHKATAARTRAAEAATWNTPLPGLDTAPTTAPVPAPRKPAESSITRFPGGMDAMAAAGLSLRVPLTTDEEREHAARFVASRARALGWTRPEHEEVIAALFVPPRKVSDHERQLHPNLYGRERP